MLQKYDIIIVGGGHSGCEASVAAANLGSKTLLITMDMSKFANMSCNPAVGGIAKGQIVREIDALGGYMGIVSDETAVQFRMLNLSKGPAMWSPRVQSDRTLFSLKWRKILENTKNLDLWQDMVVELIFEKNKIKGVKTRFGIEFSSKSVILTNGTFLNGLMHVGKNQVKGGRMGDESAFGITEQLKKIGFIADRMKTGTPVRIDGRSVDFTKLIEQKGDKNIFKFSFLRNENKPKKQLSCFIAHTNEEVHNILKTGFNDSPLFNGIIQGIGPRYCPSIEDKLHTFADKNRHQLFLEPEGWETNEHYINGFSSSLPWDIQLKALRKIKAFENLKIYRPGYAIEYDYFPPTQLHHTLETKKIENLYFSGQINGTTGYEEAAAQGLMAGINAHQKINNKEEFILKRDEAYIGVLIDDLVNKGINEPYRMFTSRAEHRILLRQDNADIRLTEKSFKIGLASKERFDILQEKKKYINETIKFIEKLSVKPEEINFLLEKLKTPPIRQKMKLKNILLRPQVKIDFLMEHLESLRIFIDKIPNEKNEIIESSEILIKYSAYIERERLTANKLKRLENLKIHKDFDFMKLKSLSMEARLKLTEIRPKNISQASRITGVSPADINVLLIFFGR